MSLSVLALQAGCALVDADENAAKLAARGRMVRATLATNTFTLTSFSRIDNPAAPVTVYIEGDGLAWKSKYEISVDPTPDKAMALQMASTDNASNVIYIARPCQFTPFRVDRNCTNIYWTSHRFAEEVIASINQAIDLAKRNGRIAGGVRLVGYSGGGAVAALVAARRADVIDLRTVAGNLDHVALNRYHNVSQMPQSLNPADVAARLARLPQIHWRGTRDRIVVAEVTASYVARVGPDKSCVTVREISGASHEDGIAEAWPSLLREQPACRR